MFETHLILCNFVYLSIFFLQCLEIFVIKLHLGAKRSYSTGCVIMSYSNCMYILFLLIQYQHSDIVCDIVSIIKLLHTFWRSLLPPYPGSKKSKKGLLMTYIAVLFSYLKFSVCVFCSVCSCIVTVITHIHQQMHIFYIKSVTLM